MSGDAGKEIVASGDEIPDGVNMFTFCQQYITGYASTIAGHVSRAPDDEHCKETMRGVMARMHAIQAYVMQRDSDMWSMAPFRAKAGPPSESPVRVNCES